MVICRSVRVALIATVMTSRPVGATIEPGQALAGEGLELGPEGTAPLVDEVRLVEDEVLQLTFARGGGQAAAEALFDRLGGGDDDTLRPGADRFANLLL